MDNELGGHDTATTDTASNSGDGGVDTTAALFDVTVQLASEVDEAAPGTVGIVTWSIDGTPDLMRARIEFGLDASYEMEAPVDLDAPEYRTLLLGMKPAHTYHFRIIAEDAATTYTSEDYVVETGPETELVSLRGFTPLKESERERGFILLSRWTGDEMAVVFIIDADGEIVWWYKTDLEGIASARMSEDGKNLWMVVSDNGGGYLGRVTMDGLDYETYQVGTSHDLTPVQGETMAYIDYSEADCNSIYEITPDGNRVEVYESQGAVSTRCHGNALRYSQKEDVYTLSILSADILIVSREGTLEWKLSDIVGPNTLWGSRQHGHHLLDDSILVFANNYGGTTSAVVEYDFDGNEILNYNSGLFSSHLGDVQRLPGGNTLISYSDDVSFIHEINRQKEVVLEIDARAPDSAPMAALGYPLWRETLYGPPPDILL